MSIPVITIRIGIYIQLFITVQQQDGDHFGPATRVIRLEGPYFAGLRMEEWARESNIWKKYVTDGKTEYKQIYTNSRFNRYIII